MQHLGSLKQLCNHVPSKSYMTSHDKLYNGLFKSMNFDCPGLNLITFWHSQVLLFVLSKYIILCQVCRLLLLIWNLHLGTYLWFERIGLVLCDTILNLPLLFWFFFLNYKFFSRFDILFYCTFASSWAAFVSWRLRAYLYGWFPNYMINVIILEHLLIWLWWFASEYIWYRWSFWISIILQEGVQAVTHASWCSSGCPFYGFNCHCHQEVCTIILHKHIRASLHSCCLNIFQSQSKSIYAVVSCRIGLDVVVHWALVFILFLILYSW